jgi:hypothetical protein
LAIDPPPSNVWNHSAIESLTQRKSNAAPILRLSPLGIAPLAQDGKEACHIFHDLTRIFVSQIALGARLPKFDRGFEK